MTRRLTPCLLLVIACVLPGAAAGAGTATQDRQAVVSGLMPAVLFAGEPEPRWSLVERMRRYRVPGVGIAVIDHGVIVWRGAYGLRNGSSKVTPHTVFQAASISKPLAATVALLLVQDHRLDLDAGVNAQLHAWQLPSSGGFTPDGVTLRRLLSHNAGIGVHGFPGYAAGTALPDERQILDGLPPANSPPIRLVQAPGSGYRYSGGGYQIAQRLMENVTGRPFADLAEHVLLGPLHLRRTAYAANLPPQFAADVATGHDYDGHPVPGGWHRYPELAAAALWSTPDDLARYLAALMHAWQGHADGPLTPALAHQMLTPAIEGMGLGLGVHGEGAARLVDQAGSTVGYRTYLIGFPARGQGAVIMTNGDGGGDLIRELCRSLARVYHWPGFDARHETLVYLTPAALGALAGDYRMRDYGFTLTLTPHGQKLVGTTPRGSRYTFRPVAPRRFVAVEDGAELVFDGHAPGRLQVWGMQGEKVAARPDTP